MKGEKKKLDKKVVCSASLKGIFSRFKLLAPNLRGSFNRTRMALAYRLLRKELEGACIYNSPLIAMLTA